MIRCCTLGSAARMSATTARRSKSRPPYRTPSQAISTLGSIWRKRSSTALVPMSGAQTLQMPPRLTTARNATIVSGMFGR